LKPEVQGGARSETLFGSSVVRWIRALSMKSLETRSHAMRRSVVDGRSTPEHMLG